MKTAARPNSGFTLLELLIAIFIFSVLATTIFISYRTLFIGMADFESGMGQYEMAQSCLTRMTNDMRSIHVNLAPLYARPQFDSAPDDYRIVGQTAYAGNREFGTLRFTSRAHVSFEKPGRDGIAEIRYYVSSREQGKFVIKRSDHLFPFPPVEERETDPVLCEEVKSLTFKFYDDSGEEQAAWDSESEDFKYATPSAVGIELEVGDEHTSRFFKTRITLPTIRKRLD